MAEKRVLKNEETKGFSIQDLIIVAVLLAGAGRMPSVRANVSAASKTLVWGTEMAFIIPSSYSWERIGLMPWYRRPPA